MKCLRGPNTLPLSLNHFIVYLLCTCRRCGTQGGATFTKMVIGDPSRMMIRFDSVKHRNEPGGKGSLSQWRRTCQVRHTAGWKLYLLIAWLFCFTSINAEVLALYMYIHIMFCLFTGCVHFPCQNDGICTDSIDGRYTCKCINGFSGDQCTDIKGKIRQIHVQHTA